MILKSSWSPGQAWLSLQTWDACPRRQGLHGAVTCNRNPKRLPWKRSPHTNSIVSDPCQCRCSWDLAGSVNIQWALAGGSAGSFRLQRRTWPVRLRHDDSFTTRQHGWVCRAFSSVTQPCSLLAPRLGPSLLGRPSCNAGLCRHARSSLGILLQTLAKFHHPGTLTHRRWVNKYDK